MTRPGTDSPPWALVDEGWGRKVVDFATLSEPGNCREYVAVHHRLGVDAGDRLLDVLQIELLECPDPLHRSRDAPVHVRIDPDLDIGADPVTDRAG